MKEKRNYHTSIWHAVNWLRIPPALKAVALNHIEQLEEDTTLPNTPEAWAVGKLDLDSVNLNRAFIWKRVGNGGPSWNDAFWFNLCLYQCQQISKKELLKTLRQI